MDIDRNEIWAAQYTAPGDLFRPDSDGPKSSLRTRDGQARNLALAIALTVV